MESLFASQPITVQTMENVYALGTLLRATAYNSLVYRQAFKSELQLVDCQTYTPDSAPKYSISYHADGMIIAMGGLQNFDQFLSYLWNSSTCTMDQQPGQVVHFLRRCVEEIKLNLILRIGAAPNKTRIVVTGYSCGGGMAPIVANWINATYGSGTVPYVVSFGSPRPGNEAFVAGITSPQLSVENAEDPVPRYPRWNSFWSSVSTFPEVSRFTYPPGRPVVLLESGAIALSRRLQIRPGEADIAYKTITSIGADPFGSVHGLREYLRRMAIGFALNRSHSRFDPLFRLNRAMDFGVEPANSEQTVPAPVTSPIPTPPGPTIALVQGRPTSGGAPGDPVPPVYDNTFVGQTQRVYSMAVVASSSTGVAVSAFHGSDLRILKHAAKALDLIGERDMILWRPKPSAKTRRSRAVKLVKAALFFLGRIEHRDSFNTDKPRSRSLSTNAYMIDPFDADTLASLSAVKTALTDAQTSVTANTEILDRSNNSLMLAFESLQLHLQNLIYFGSVD